MSVDVFSFAEEEQPTGLLSLAAAKTFSPPGGPSLADSQISQQTQKESAKLLPAAQDLVKPRLERAVSESRVSFGDATVNRDLFGEDEGTEADEFVANCVSLSCR